MFRRSPEWFKTWVQDTFVPVVLVRVSKNAEESVKKNNLSFVDLLRPYQDMNKTITIPRISRDHDSYTLSSFKLRFRTINELEPPSDNERTSLFGACLQEPIEDVSDEALPAANLRVIGAAEDTASSDQKPNVRGDEEYTPWYDAVREEVPLTVRCAEHECFEHPVACINVVSTQDTDPVTTLRSLSFRRSALPTAIRGYPVDDDILQCYVLLHDVQHAPVNTTQINNKLDPIKEAFGASVCRVLHINSRKQDAPGVETDIWTPYMPRNRRLQSNDPAAEPTSDNKEDVLLPDLVDPTDTADHHDSKHTERRPRLGEHLCPREDLTYFSNLVTEFLAPQIVSRMTEKMRHTYTHIVSKRGLRNRMLGWFRKPSKDEEAETVRNNFRIRQLADYAFMLRDYDLALSNYNLVASDYKNKDVRMHAGALEMASLVSFVNEDKMRDADLDAAVQQYASDIGAGMHALRASLFLAALHIVAGDLPRAAAVYIRSAEHAQRVLRDALIPALLLEQTAFCHLMQGEGDGINEGGLLSGMMTAAAAAPTSSLTPSLASSIPDPTSASVSSASASGSGRKIGQYRKYGLYLVLAGYRYSTAHQIRHSYRCYAAAMPIYRGRAWSQVDDHLHITLGRLNAHMEHLEQAVSYLHELVTSCHQPARTQSVFLENFVEVAHRYLNAVGATRLDPLRIPVIQDSTLEVVLSDNPPPPRSPWRALEDSLLRSVRPNYVASWARSLASVPRNSHTAVGESVYVEVDVHNPLHIPVVMSQLQLTTCFTPRHDEKEGAGTAKATEDHDEGDGHGGRRDRNDQRGEERHELVHGDSHHHQHHTNSNNTSPADTPTHAQHSAGNTDTPSFLTHSPSLPAFPSPASSSSSPSHHHASGSPSSETRSSPSSPSGHNQQLRSSASAAQFSNTNDDPWSMLGEDNDAPGGSRDSADGDQQDTAADDHGNDGGRVQCHPVDVQLQPSETKRVRLCITPEQEGTLEITGAQWMLGNRICGRHRFQIRGPRLSKTKAQRSGKRYGDDHRLHLTVTPPMPLLSLGLTGMPQQLWHGETVRASMEITNTGQLPLTQLKLKPSHPSFVAIGHPESTTEDSSAAFPSSSSFISVSSSSSSVEKHVPVSSRMTTEPLSVIHIPLPNNRNQSHVLPPNTSIHIPLYIRGGVPGVHDLRFLFYYESDQPSSEMPYRVHRYMSPLQVAEALALRTVPRPAASSQHDIVLGLEVRNRRRSPVSLQQISAISPSWDVQLVSNLSTTNSHTVIVEPEVVTTLYFRIIQRRKSSPPQKQQKQQTKQKAESDINNDNGADDNNENNIDDSVGIKTEENSSHKSSGFSSSLPHLNVRTLSMNHSDTSTVIDITTHPFLEFLFRAAATMPIHRGRGGTPTATTNNTTASPNIHSSISAGDVRMRSRCSLLPVYAPLSRPVSDRQSAPPSARRTPRHQRRPGGEDLPEEEERDIEDIFPFVRDQEGLALSVIWRSEDGRMGQSTLPHVSFLHGATVQPHHSIGLPAPPPVKVNLRYDAQIEHSFSCQPMCVTQVIFTLCNVSVNTPINVTIELISPLTIRDPSSRTPNIPFQWLGTTKLSFTGVSSGSSIEVPVNVAFFSPGIYNLASYRLWWTVPEQRGRQPTLLKPVKTQYLLHVNEKH